MPNVLSRRIRTLSPGIVTLAIRRTVAFVSCASPSVCCDVPQAVTHVARPVESCATTKEEAQATKTSAAVLMGGRLLQNMSSERDGQRLHLASARNEQDLRALVERRARRAHIVNENHDAIFE